jgi:hypothetical protein
MVPHRNTQLPLQLGKGRNLRRDKAHRCRMALVVQELPTRMWNQNREAAAFSVVLEARRSSRMWNGVTRVAEMHRCQTLQIMMLDGTSPRFRKTDIDFCCIAVDLACKMARSLYVCEAALRFETCRLEVDTQ